MRNPSAKPHTCPDCGTKTKVNRRTGFLFRHFVPGTTRVCRASERLVIRLNDLEDGDPVYNDKRSVSIRAWRGGLPTLGKRRK